MHLAYGSAARFAKNAQILSWEDVAVRVGELLEQRQFATNVELAECGTFEKRQLAEQLWYMSHDISEKAIEAGHMSIVRSLRGGFPEETEKLMFFLSEPESYQAIMKSSYRTLPLVAPFEAILKRMKAEQEENITASVSIVPQRLYPIIYPRICSVIISLST